ncbi:TPA: hypothetical protein HA361_06810 [Candidatus Woesearchaeota archaeon]|nr:hypothetical protein [Candidatus Woesearchaeota archaeon]HII69188.1 hypothetical protein [Candidatus Woesearchaeota archaeon]
MSIHLTNLNKKQRKRWGKKFIDRRDWHAYNEELVRVGEYMLDYTSTKQVSQISIR